MTELLTVMGVIAVLAALAGVAVKPATQNRDVLRSLANLRQVGAASLMYSAENNGEIPQSAHNGRSWQQSLRPYLGGEPGVVLGPISKGSALAKVMRSPLDPHPTRVISYAINDFLTAHPYGAEELDYSRRSMVAAPQATLLFTIGAKKLSLNTDHFHFADPEGGFTPSAFSEQVAVELARGEGHYLFLDGHVEALPWREVQLRLADPASGFIHPDQERAQ